MDCYHAAIMNDNVCSPSVVDCSPPVVDSITSTSIIRDMLDEKNKKKQNELFDKMTSLEEDLKRIKEELKCVKRQSKNFKTMSNAEIIRIYENQD